MGLVWCWERVVLIVTHRQPVTVFPLVGWMLSCVALACVIAAAVGAMAGWTDTVGAVMPGFLAGASFIAGAAPSLLIASSALRGRSRNFGLYVAVGGGLRILLSVFIALAVYLIASPEGRVFWSCFLLAGLSGLAAETVWAMSAARSLTGAAPRGGGNGDGVSTAGVMIPAESTGAVS